MGAAILRIAERMGVQTEGVQLSSWKKTSKWLRGESVLLLPILMLHHSQNNSNPPPGSSSSGSIIGSYTPSMNIYQ